MWTEETERVIRTVGEPMAAALWDPEGAGGSGKDKRAGKNTLEQRLSMPRQMVQSRSGVASETTKELLEMSGLDAIKARFINIIQTAVLDRKCAHD